MGGLGIGVRRLGGNQAGELRLTRFLRNPAVTMARMVESVAAGTRDRCAGRHILAIQDTTVIRSEGGGGHYLHPVIAVDAQDGALPEDGRTALALPAQPGRPDRDVVLAIRFTALAIARPKHGLHVGLPKTTIVQAVDVRAIDPATGLPIADIVELDDIPLLRAFSTDLDDKTARQKNPHPLGSPAYAARVCARLGGWTGFYGKPGPTVMLAGWLRFQAAERGAGLQVVQNVVWIQQLADGVEVRYASQKTTCEHRRRAETGDKKPVPLPDKV